MTKILEPYSDKWCAKAVDDTNVPDVVKAAVVSFGIANNQTDQIMKRWFGQEIPRSRSTLEQAFIIALGTSGCEVDDVFEFVRLGYLPIDSVSTFREWTEDND